MEYDIIGIPPGTKAALIGKTARTGAYQSLVKTSKTDSFIKYR
jgi:hypothetical protein